MCFFVKKSSSYLIHHTNLNWRKLFTIRDYVLHFLREEKLSCFFYEKLDNNLSHDLIWNCFCTRIPLLGSTKIPQVFKHLFLDQQIIFKGNWPKLGPLLRVNTFSCKIENFSMLQDFSRACVQIPGYCTYCRAGFFCLIPEFFQGSMNPGNNSIYYI